MATNNKKQRDKRLSNTEESEEKVAGQKEYTNLLVLFTNVLSVCCGPGTVLSVDVVGERPVQETVKDSPSLLFSMIMLEGGGGKFTKGP